MTQHSCDADGGGDGAEGKYAVLSTYNDKTMGYEDIGICDGMVGHGFSDGTYMKDMPIKIWYGPQYHLLALRGGGGLHEQAGPAGAGVASWLRESDTEGGHEDVHYDDDHDGAEREMERWDAHWRQYATSCNEPRSGGSDRPVLITGMSGGRKIVVCPSCMQDVPADVWQQHSCSTCSGDAGQPEKRGDVKPEEDQHIADQWAWMQYDPSPPEPSGTASPWWIANPTGGNHGQCVACDGWLGSTVMQWRICTCHAPVCAQ